MRSAWDEIGERYLRLTLDGGVASGVAWVKVLQCRLCGSLVPDTSGGPKRHDDFHARLENANAG